MATDDPENDRAETEPDADPEPASRVDVSAAKERLERGADRAATEFDEGVVDLLAWLLDTETRARIYVDLRSRAGSTSQEVADHTGIYPSTVREAVVELHEDGVVTREKRENGDAGNNPYEYRAIPPSELVRSTVGRVQRQLNAVFNLDERFGNADGPVQITVDGDVTEDREAGVSASDKADTDAAGEAAGAEEDGADSTEETDTDRIDEDGDAEGGAS